MKIRDINLTDINVVLVERMSQALAQLGRTSNSNERRMICASVVFWAHCSKNTDESPRDEASPEKEMTSLLQQPMKTTTILFLLVQQHISERQKRK